MNYKVCPECQVAVLRPHHELVWWYSCSVCRYAEFNIDLIHPKNREKALKNKYANRVNILDEKLWKPWLRDEEDH